MQDSLDDIFKSFIYTGMSDEERAQLQAYESEIGAQMQTAVDHLRGVLVDREGREALAKALKERIGNV